MELSDQLAKKYARYRLRMLEGPLGTYQGGQYEALINGIEVIGQRHNTRVSFLRNVAHPHPHPGSYVIGCKYKVDKNTSAEPGNLETAHIDALQHGDNVIHAAWMFLTFVCEYLITYDLTALELANSILGSFQRLGDYSPGYGEPTDPDDRPAGETWGYMLRVDTVDDKEENERIQTWLKDTLPSERSPLEPSPDQYTSMLCTGVIALRLLREAEEANDAEWPTDAQHTKSRQVLKERVEERVRASHRYIAEHSRYLLRRSDGQLAGRGGWCYQFGFEFARVAAKVLPGIPRNHFQPFSVKMLPDIINIFVAGHPGEFAHTNAEYMAALVLGGLEGLIFQIYVTQLRKEILQKLRKQVPIIDKTASLWDFLEERGWDLLNQNPDEIIKKKIADWLKGTIHPKLYNMIKPILEKMLDNNLLDKEVSIALSQFLFELWASVFFERPLPKFSEGLYDSPQCASLLGDLGLVNPDLLDSAVTFPEIKIDLTTREFPTKIFGVSVEVPAINWGEFRLNCDAIPPIDWQQLMRLHTIPVKVGAYYALQATADFLDWTEQQYNDAVNGDTDLNPFDADFMPFGYFVLMATNGSFEEHGFDEMDVAENFNNCLFMALNHRLLGQSGDRVDKVMNILNSAPDGFPNGRDPNLWDKDFRWLRGKHPDLSDELFSGLDFMCALMIAASVDAAKNRKKLRQAIEEAITEGSQIEVLRSEGVFYLPFRGPVVSTREVFNPDPRMITEATSLHMGVVFALPGAPGKVVVRVRPGDDPGSTIEFRQDQPEKVVVIPFLEPHGLALESVETGVAGMLVVAPTT